MTSDKKRTQNYPTPSAQVMVNPIAKVYLVYLAAQKVSNQALGVRANMVTFGSVKCKNGKTDKRSKRIPGKGLSWKNTEFGQKRCLFDPNKFVPRC